MGLATAFFGIALLVTATAVIPIALAAMVERQTPSALWLRRHLRWIWATAAFSWLVSLTLKLVDRSPLSRLEFITSAAGFLATVAAALLDHRSRAHAAPPA
jgi:hypothetical protein